MGRKNGRPGGVKVGAAKKGVQKIEIPSFVSLTLASRNLGRLGPKTSSVGRQICNADVLQIMHISSDQGWLFLWGCSIFPVIMRGSDWQTFTPDVKTSLDRKRCRPRKKVENHWFEKLIWRRFFFFFCRISGQGFLAQPRAATENICRTSSSNDDFFAYQEAWIWLHELRSYHRKYDYLNFKDSFSNQIYSVQFSRFLLEI